MGKNSPKSRAHHRQRRLPGYGRDPMRWTVAFVLLTSLRVWADEPLAVPPQGFIQRYCLECHQAPRPKADLDLTPYVKGTEALVRDALAWDDHLVRVREGEMPPDDDDVRQPTKDEIQAFVSWVETTLRTAAAADGLAPGPAMVRRLNRTEYSASVRALLDVHFDAGASLPDDGAGGEGFDNAAETLFISPIHAEKYLDAARAAIDYAFADTRAHRAFLIARPDAETTPQQAAERVLERFLPRAFRRPLTEEELQTYLELFEAGYASQDQSYEAGLKLALSAALVSPKFLFIAEAPNTAPDPVLVGDHELATRLAYFLWGSPPDDALLEQAHAGTLQEEEVLAAEVRRMLGRRHTSKVQTMVQAFVEQWLGTRALGREFKPDASIKGYGPELEGGMKYEPVFFIHEILAKNRPLLDLLDADYTYANRHLARHYGIRDKGRFREQPRRVEIADLEHRGGLLGMAAVLTVSSHPHRTSPVLRGKWILETLLGEPTPPPPPDVPELEEHPEEETAQTLRQRLEAHRANPTCATCHDRIDPLGFSLENYDVLGRWRTEESGQPIDASGTLPDGTAFSGPEELKAILMARKDQVMRQFTKKMLGYALGRGLTYEDFATVDAIVEDLRAHDYQSHRLLLGIVQSVPFRFKAGTEPDRGVEPDR